MAITSETRRATVAKGEPELTGYLFVKEKTPVP